MHKKRIEPSFFTTDRDGKIAVWARFPNGDSFNIADFRESELTDKVRAAIERSFARGLEAARMHIEEAAWYLQPSMQQPGKNWPHHGEEEL
jgi:hypothetical protein